MMVALRAAIASLLLFSAALFGIASWSLGTCTGNAPDELYGGTFVLVLNLAGLLLLWRGPRWPMIAILVAVPTIAAIYYSCRTLEFVATGMPACTAVTGDPGWEPSGDEARLRMLWSIVALSYWLALALVVGAAYRSGSKGN